MAQSYLIGIRDGPQNNESIKITLRFLSNEIRSDSIKVILHKKKCSIDQSCAINLIKQSLIIDELQSSILRKAAQIEVEQKRKKNKLIIFLNGKS